MPVIKCKEREETEFPLYCAWGDDVDLRDLENLKLQSEREK